ncbi:MAG TPA: translational GTPase TypA [Gaiellales bacterium]|nr:translational GTPase TypA [Gaiellales bacterium]
MQPRDDIRNIAIIAHVDHGKTTLVDALLRQSGTFAEHEQTVDRVMDAGLERERGITILAKNTAVRFGDVKVNIIDTPGHADFGGEVERGLSMVDGVLLLVDASEGPLPQTRFVLRKALAGRLPVILVVNKIDRPDARIAEVVDEVYALFFDEDADESQIDFPIVYTNARLGTATLDPDVPGESIRPLLDLIVSHMPAPTSDPAHPFQAQVANLDSSPYLGRLALCRVRHGEIERGSTVAWCRRDGTVTRIRLTELLVAEGLERVPAERAGPGDIIAVAGLAEVMIGETIADPDDPRALPLIVVDEPSLAVTIAINTSPLAGRSGTRLTARMIKDRLDRELLGNVGLRVLDTDRPDTWEVQGRGEMQFAVLAEMMRREGYEITIGKPRVVTRTVDGKLEEPVERVSIDVPEEYSGVVIQALALRKGRMESMTNHGTGWVRLEHLVPARGLLGFRSEFQTETRGTGQLHHVFEEYGRWAGEIKSRPNGSLVADRTGQATGYSIQNLQARGVLFVGSGEDVYEGMIVGENSRTGDLDVNITKAKQMTNVRSNADVLVRLNPPHRMSLDQAIEYIQEGECVEVTPEEVRLRKAVLSASERNSQRSKAARGV